MDLHRENDRKGLVGTIFIHIIIFLLLLIMIVGDKNQMVEAKEGVEVSFGELDAGGSDAISEVAESSDAAAEPESSPTETEATPTPDPPVVTNDQTEAPEVKSSSTKKTTKSEETVTKPSIDSDLQKRLDALKNKKSNSENSSNAGDGPNKGPGGDPNADKSGPGGVSSGNLGGGVGYSLEGFGATGTPLPNNSQNFGKLVMAVELNKNGQIVSIRPTAGSTTTDPFLIDLAERSIRQFIFSANGSEKAVNLGTFTFNYKAR